MLQYLLSCVKNCKRRMIVYLDWMLAGESFVNIFQEGLSSS